MLETLDAAAVRRWCGGGLDALRAHQREIDELNVYPVPDGDTGTNLVLTLTSAQEALEAVWSDASSPDADVASAGGDAASMGGDVASAGGDVASMGGDAASMGGDRASFDGGRAELTPHGRALGRMARGALLGARGNSGVIVSQILRGMADSLGTSVVVRGGELARALRSASEAAYAAVARPVEGTVLSVVAAAADGAGRIKSDDLVVVARAAARAASEALALTPQQLPVLARAGVVDAGGRGLCLLLDALVEALAPSPSSSVPPSSGPPSSLSPSSAAPSSLPASGHAEVFGYEVQYLLDADEATVAGLRVTLDGLGDSLVVVGSGDGTWNVHVHVSPPNIGPAVEAGVVAGRPHHISVTPLEPGRPHAAAEPPVTEAPALSGQGRSAVVVAAGDGLTALFEAEGATVVDRNPSIREMIEAIKASGAGSVVLLPND